jgi:hypothetical protein
MRGLSFQRWAGVSTAGALLLSLAVPVTAAAAATTTTTTTVTVPATQPWTGTGISLPAGTVSFKASGTINVAGGDPDGNNTPNGDGPANPTCIAGPGEYSGSWTAPGLPCWSLIGRVGNGTPFFIGDSANLDIKTPGELYLGVNDETGYFGDNSGSWTVQVTSAPSTPSPSPTCDAAGYRTVVTQHAGVPELPELFTDKVTLTWCADPGSQPQIFSASQSPDVQDSGFTLSGILLELYKTAGLTFGVTPATAPDPATSGGSGSASVTASGLSFNQTLNLGQDLVALIPAGLLARAGLRLLPFLRSGQAARLSTELAAVWSAAVATIAAALARNFGLPQWAGKLLADFGLGKLLDTVKAHAEQFAAQAATSLAGLGRHPALTSVISTLQSAVKTAASALTFTKELWGPQITVTVASGQHPSVNDRASYADLWINVQALHVTTTPAS